MSRLIDAHAQHARRRCRAAHVSPTAADLAWARLSPREQEVIERVTRPHRTRRRVAAELGISLNTVNRHISHAYTKLDVRTLAEVVRLVGSSLEIRRSI